MIRDTDKYFSMCMKTLTFGDNLKPLPFMENYLKENPQFQACFDMYQPFFSIIGLYYTKTIHGINLDTRTRDIDAATAKTPIFQDPDEAEILIGQYEQGYKTFQDVMKERKAS